MEIRIRSTGAVVSEREFRQLHSATNLPSRLPLEMIQSLGGDVVLASPAPEVGEYQTAARDGVVQDDLENWVYKWTVIDWPKEQIDAAVASAKSSKNTQINEWRAQANQSYFTHEGKQVACDALSRSDIDGVAGSISLTGGFPVGFPNVWKAMDNTYIAIPDVDAFKAMYNSMTLQGALNFDRAQKLKAKLEAATSLSEINAINWEMPLE